MEHLIADSGIQYITKKLNSILQSHSFCKEAEL